MVSLVDTGQHTIHARPWNKSIMSIEDTMSIEDFQKEVPTKRIMSMGNEIMSIEIHPSGGSGETQIMSMEETMSIEIHPSRGSGET